MEIERPAKRAKLNGEGQTGDVIHQYGHYYGVVNISASATAHLGNSHQVAPADADNKDVDKYETLRKSLLFDRIDDRIHNVKKPLVKTCTWLFQHPDFKEWRLPKNVSQHNGFLWVKGKPGCGKSTIMKSALEWTRREVKKQCSKQILVHYFFNARAPNSLEKSSLGLYRSITHQILHNCPAARSIFTEKFALKEPGESGDAWSKAELQDFLYDVVLSDTPPELCIFIDALDEGEHEEDVRELINFLVDLAEHALDARSACGLSICLSSRHYPHISIKKGLSLIVELQLEHSQDIDTYIQRKLNGADHIDKVDLKSELHRKSGSIFLWVVLVVEILNQVEDRGNLYAQMRKQLDSIPSDLHKLFQEILLKTTHGIEASVILLQWVLFSMRPLAPQELYTAIQFGTSPVDPTWSVEFANKTLPLDDVKRYILNCSRGLVEVTLTNPPTVQFIHETAREFLMSETGLAFVLPDKSNNLVGLSHEMLKQTCARCVSISPIPTEFQIYILEAPAKADHATMKKRLSAQMPFIIYAVTYLLAHAEQAQAEGISQDLLLRTRLGAGNVWQIHERLWWNLLQRYNIRKHVQDVPMLYMVAEQGHTLLVSALLKIPQVDINDISGRYGCALQAACVGGHQEIVQSLLDAGARVDLECGEYDCSFVAAVINGRAALLPILLEHKPHPPQASLEKAMATIAARGFADVIEVLLSMGITADGVRGSVSRPLIQAAGKGHLNVVSMLLRAGADVNAESRDGSTALLAAAENCRLSVMQLLLDNGAAIDSRVSQRRTALSLASLFGHLPVVDLLLQRGADIEGEMGADALIDASRNGYLKIVRVLVEKGVSLDARGTKFGSALIAACFHGEVQLVQWLIEQGADIEASDKRYGTPLVAACHSPLVRPFDGTVEVVKLLLKRGANVHALSGEFGSALGAALANGNQELAKLLREYGAVEDNPDALSP